MRKTQFINNRYTSAISNHTRKNGRNHYNNRSTKTLFDILKKTSNLYYDLEISKQKRSCSIRKTAYPQDVIGNKYCNKITKGLKNKKRQNNKNIKSLEKLYKSTF